MRTCVQPLLGATLLLWLAASSCSVLKPKADLTRFYVLRAPEPASKSPSTKETTLAEIRVGPGQLADYLDTTPIVIKEEADRLKFLDGHHWAEGLPKGINRVLGQSLGSALPGFQMSLYPEPASQTNSLELDYWITRFEGPLEGPVRLEVSWQLRQRPGRNVLISTQNSYEIPVDRKAAPVDSYVKALAEAIGRWATDVAEAIRNRN